MFDDAFDYAWFNHPELGVDRAWQFLDGLGIPDDLPNSRLPFDWEPVRLGIIDGAFATNNDWLHSRVDDHYCISFDFTPVLHAMSTCVDCCDSLSLVGTRGGPAPWHGTCVHGVATALLDNRYGAAGTAGLCGGPITEVMLGRWTGTLYAAAVEIEAIARGPFGQGADVISMSFTVDCNWWCRTFASTMESGQDALYDALRLARDRGVIPVAAAGNAGFDLGYEDFWGHRTILPCEGPGVVCVGAVDWSCVPGNCFPHMGYSSFGESVDIWAPTNIRVWAPDPADDNYPPLFGHIQRTVGGTSMSTPYVSGVLAMIKALYSPTDRDSFDSDAAHLLLRDTASFLVSTSARVNSHGGLIDPIEMVLTQASRLGLTEADVDENEPNDSRVSAVSLNLGDTVSGVIAPAADEDWYELDVHDYWDLTAQIASGTDPQHLEIGLYRGATFVGWSTPSAAGRPVLSAALDPGRYYLGETCP